MKYVNDDLRKDIRNALSRSFRGATDKALDNATDMLEKLFEQWWNMRITAAMS